MKSKPSRVLYIWRDDGVTHSRGHPPPVPLFLRVHPLTLHQHAVLSGREGHLRLNSSLGLLCLLRARPFYVSIAAEDTV